MKKQSYKSILFLSVLVLIVSYACNKSFLDKQPQGSLNPGVLANRSGVDALLIGAYHMVSGQGGAAGNNWGAAASNWVYGSVASDDAYKGSVVPDQEAEGMGPLARWSYLPTNGYLTQKWQAMYDGVQRANDVLRILPQATDVPAADAARITAEARFLRGHFHFELKRVFNYIPYADENTTQTSNVDASGNFIDVWPMIEADFQAAIDGLPETQAEAGRANKSAAKVYLARCYVQQRKFDLAKPLLDDVIANGMTARGEHYTLVNYESNFNAPQDNNAESVWACQNSVNDGSGTNGNYGDNLMFPNGSGPGGCCGFGNPSLSLANAYKTDAATGLPMFDTYNTGTVVNDSANLYVGTLDPRIDFVMGRPGIPYYDWGIMPSEAWIREPSSNGFFVSKKEVYAQSQVGTVSSTETSFWAPTQMSAINVNLIRFAEVLLWAAECEMAVGSPATALTYVNRVRTRAADPSGWVYKNSDYDANIAQYTTRTTPADKYKIGLYPAGAFDDPAYAARAILFEERLELAMEGQRYFTLQRWDAGTPGLMAAELNSYAEVEKTRPSYVAAITPTPHFTQGKNEYFPIPQSQIDVKNATGTVALKQNPAY